MNSATAARLLEIDRRFYSERGRDFSETRLRLQPGVKRVLESFQGNETILDLGCGNGELARALSDRGHRGSYLGLDFSPTLLDAARSQAFAFPVEFKQVDLTQISAKDLDASTLRRAETLGAWQLGPGHWSTVVAFSVLHHIPGLDHRRALLRNVHRWLEPGGRLIHSSWQFVQSTRLRSRIQPWAAAGVAQDDVDPNDYLLDWRRGGRGLRYVHQFNEVELMELATASGFLVMETFYSDGADRKSGLYQVWKKSWGPA